jgi:hypothetical protein
MIKLKKRRKKMFLLRLLMSLLDSVDPPGVNKDPGFLGAALASGTAATSPVGLATGVTGAGTTASGVF